jgi:hypothetical protein
VTGASAPAAAAAIWQHSHAGDGTERAGSRTDRISSRTRLLLPTIASSSNICHMVGAKARGTLGQSTAGAPGAAGAGAGTDAVAVVTRQRSRTKGPKQPPQQQQPQQQTQRARRWCVNPFFALARRHPLLWHIAANQLQVCACGVCVDDVAVHACCLLLLASPLPAACCCWPRPFSANTGRMPPHLHTPNTTTIRASTCG